LGGAGKRVGFLVGLLLLPAIAVAQSGGLRDRDPDLEGTKKVLGELQQANIHSGRFYMISRIRLADAGFAEDYYLPTGEARGGINLRIEAPQRIYIVPQRKTIFSFDFVPSYSWLHSGNKSGQFDYAARADAHFLLNHLYLDPYVLYTDQIRAQVADVNRLATERVREGGLNTELKYSSRTSAIFSARHRILSFPGSRFQPEDRLVSQLDRTEENGRLALHHKTFPLTSLFVAGELSKYEFKRAGEKDSKRRYFGGGFIRSAGRTSLRVEAGQTQLDFDDPAQADFDGLTGQISVSRATGRWTTTVTGTRDIGFSIFANNNYYKANTLRLALENALTRKLTLRLGSTFERDNYDFSANGILRRDDLSYTYVGFIYSFRRLRLGADVGWFERDSNFLADDSGIRWVLHLSFTP